MKKLIFTSLLALFVAFSASALDLVFKWSANPSNEMVTSYVIQQATGTNVNFNDIVTAPGTTNTWAVKNVNNGLYRFRLVAVNGVGRSVPSVEIAYPTNAPSQPAQFQLIFP